MRLATPAGLIVALALISGPPRTTSASSIASHMQFASTGSVATAGITGPSALRFEGSGEGHLTTGAPFDLGRFVATPGASADYKYTPFDVSFAVRSVDGVATPDGPSVGIQGWLVGPVVNGDASGVRVVLVEQAPNEGSNLPPYVIPPFQTGPYSSVLAIAPGGVEATDPGGSIHVRLVASSVPIPSPAPEPSTIAIFVGAGLLALARRRSRGFWAR